jgi:formylmethanofuran:tetrahydromethanopterin formyltransferase
MTGRRAGEEARFEIGRDADGWYVRDRVAGRVVTSVPSSLTGLFRIEAELLRDVLNQTLQRHSGARRDA